MKKSVILLSFLFFTSCFGITEIFAQKEIEKSLFAKLSIPDEEVGKVFHTFEVPDNFNFDSSLIGGGFATVDCTNCALTSSYHFWLLKAEKLENTKIKLGIDAYFANKPKCNVKGEFIFDLSKKESSQKLKCGIKVLAFYSPKLNTK